MRFGGTHIWLVGIQHDTTPNVNSGPLFYNSSFELLQVVLYYTHYRGWWFGVGVIDIVEQLVLQHLLPRYEVSV